MIQVGVRDVLQGAYDMGHDMVLSVLLGAHANPNPNPNRIDTTNVIIVSWG